MEQLAVLHVHVNKHRETQPHAWEGDNKTCEKSCDPWFVRPRPNVPLLGRSWASAQEHRERCWKWHAGHDRSTQMQVGERAAGRKHRRLVSVNALSQDWGHGAAAHAEGGRDGVALSERRGQSSHCAAHSRHHPSVQSHPKPRLPWACFISELSPELKEELSREHRGGGRRTAYWGDGIPVSCSLR